MLWMQTLLHIFEKNRHPWDEFGCIHLLWIIECFGFQTNFVIAERISEGLPLGRFLSIEGHGIKIHPYLTFTIP